MRNEKRRSSSKIDEITPKKAYNLRDRSQRPCYKDPSESEFELQGFVLTAKNRTVGNKREKMKEVADLENFPEPKEDATAENTAAGAQKAMETGVGASNIPSGNSAVRAAAAANNNSGEDNVAGGSGAQNDIQNGQEPPMRFLVDLNVVPDPEDE